MGKRGQAAGTAVLLAIVAALIIMFIILIPPQERAELLGEDLDDGDSTGDIDNTITQKTLLTVSPGRVDYLAQKEIEHPLPVVNIYTKTEAKTLAEKNIAYVKRGIFSEQTSELKFYISDLENTENALLSLGVLENPTGRLIITLNGDEIFNAEVGVGNLQPIKLPSNTLQENNILTFAVSSPGLAFWATNDMSLQKIKVIADVTSLEAQSSNNIFLVSETEKKNLEKVLLKFQPSCNYAEVGKLTVSVNGRIVYSAIPDCELQMAPLEISPENLNQGENEIVFHTVKGAYLLTHVVVESKLREVDFPAYYFDLSYEQYQAIKDNQRRVKVTLAFVDVVASKSGNLEFNGHINYFDTKELSYTFDLSKDVVQGANAIKIKPKKTIDVRELKVELVK